ncbi:MAG TPA: DUF4865 domain-containing protein [Erwinia persicina]|uniref:DUF4865 domain-containing protein n=1 Tax=Erwinia persicina TaxID=55211 RepID=A0A4U3FED5_9GAMM|nr:DUF4865 family protein [Erwinia persicina]MBC3944448.1 DUF4865 family protein [Erwinia persicina]MBD8105946.1 DUF4865 family protein [Erwinia persicina]MBD8168343.1 DUF4865 family protein [Erwinia persicina]MBD8208911.1 DUF4865 family protein [Erwinia persicina]QZQ49541.1 DUF4865 family protein [Erwinia persicina]
MIAMQYRFRLPSDYDMAIITNRICENGHRLDGFPGLLLKAYCYADDSGPQRSSDPLYAPFYLWQDSDSMTRFLTSSGFQRLTQDYGWPQIDSWLVLHYQPAAELANAGFARRIITPITPYTELIHYTPAIVEHAAPVSQILAWDVQTWRHLTFQISPLPFSDVNSAECYRVGHISLPLHIA